MMRMGLSVGFFSIPNAADIPVSAALAQPSESVMAARETGSPLPHRGLAPSVLLTQT